MNNKKSYSCTKGGDYSILDRLEESFNKVAKSKNDSERQVLKEAFDIEFKKFKTIYYKSKKTTLEGDFEKRDKIFSKICSILSGEMPESKEISDVKVSVVPQENKYMEYGVGNAHKNSVNALGVPNNIDVESNFYKKVQLIGKND